MKRILNIYRFLTSAKGWEAVFLTLTFFFFPACNVYAVDDETASITVPTVSGQPATSPFDEIDKGHRVGLLLNYVRHEAPGWAPGLRETLRAPLGWARSIGRAFGSDDDNAADETDETESFIPPLFRSASSLMQPPADAESQALWLTPGYHHKGFLPFHDAMMTGVDFRQRVLDGRMQFDLRPFYGQNWVSLNGYGGAELGIGLTHGGETQPWGRIGLRYTDGASYLMDHGRGFDMNAEMRFDKDLSLNAGVRGDVSSDLGNYVMLRWKLAEFGK